jgi:RNase P subunit RPR2
MHPRFICPHCHSPVDPLKMDVVTDERATCRICPECDEPIVVATNSVASAATTAEIDDDSSETLGVCESATL